MNQTVFSATQKIPIRSLSCESCGASLSLQLGTLAKTVVCGSCGSLLNTASKNAKLIDHLAQHKETFDAHSKLPLGINGRLDTILWKCVGFLQKHLTEDESQIWDEYLLYNPYEGFSFLVCEEGQWIFSRVMTGIPVIGSQNKLFFNQKPFEKTNEVTSTVAFVYGEFYWPIKAGDTISHIDYMNKDSNNTEVVSVERTENEVTFSIGRLVPSEKISEAFFQNETTVPRGNPNSYLLPNPWKSRVIDSLKPTAIGLAFLVFLYLVAAITDSNKEYFSQTLQGNTSANLVNTKSFEHQGPLELLISPPSGLIGNAFSIEGSIVDSKSGERTPFHASWNSESTTDPVTLFAGMLPKGEYHISLTSAPQNQAFLFKAKSASTDKTGFLGGLIALLAMPGLFIFKLFKSQNMDT